MLKSFFLSQKVCLCNFTIKAEENERCFFLMKLNVFSNAEDRFSCVRAFLQSKSFESFTAKNH